MLPSWSVAGDTMIDWTYFVNQESKPYTHRDFMYEEYMIRKKSIRQLSRELKRDRNVIKKWLIRFDLLIRGEAEATHLVEANHCSLTPKIKEFIDGELLGDMYIESRCPFSASISYTSKYKEYLIWLSGILTKYGIQQAGKIKIGSNGIPYYHSRKYPELLEFRKRFYPHGTKIVPKDIELTPLVCRQWYIGDGCLQKREKHRPYIELSTDGFSVSDTQLLVLKLKELNFRTSRYNSNNKIRISGYSTEDFLDYIGKCPVKCYAYKWCLGSKIGGEK